MNVQMFIILCATCTGAHLVRLVYEILKHKKVLVPGRLSFIIIFINMVILWMSWVALCSIDVYRITVPALIKYSGLVLCGIGIIIFITSLLTIRSLETYEGDLITRGIYSKIRHPMYLSFILWLFGFSVFSEAGISFLLAFSYASNILIWRYLEEKELDARFPAYHDYKKRTYF